MLIRRDQDPLLNLVSWLHAGAASPEMWKRGLDLLSDLTGGSQILVGTTPHVNGPFDLHGHRMDPDVVARINGPLASSEANPVFACVPLSAIQDPVIVSSRLSDRELLQSRVYHEALKPSGIRHTMALLLDCDSRQAVTLAVGRSSAAGDYDADDAKLLAVLAPHIRSALELQRQLAVDRLSSSALEGTSRALLLVSQSGEICYANAEANRILAANDGLGAGPGGLYGGRGAEKTTLTRLVAEAALASTTPGAAGGGYVALSRPSMRECYVVRVAPAAVPLQLHHALKPQPMAAVFVRDVERQPRPSIESLQAIYGLTRMEAEVAIEVHDGYTIAELSQALGISANTAKTHLKNIFEKVGVSRQSALVSRLSGIGSEV